MNVECNPIPNVFIIIPTQEIGGAEKRFVGLWLFLQNHKKLSIKIVIAKKLYEKIKTIQEFDGIERFENNVIVYEAERRGTFDLIKNFRQFYLQYRETNSIFHYVLISPFLIHFLPTSKTIFTIPSTSLGHYSFKGLLRIYLGILQASKTDILDPKVYENLKNKFFFKRKRIFQTPSSYVDCDFYSGVPFEEKKNWLVFLGLLSEEKQVFKLIEYIPYISHVLKQNKIANPEFFILGRYTKDNPRNILMQSRIEKYQSEGIKIQAYFESNPQNILKNSKVFFSLQKNNNYPSKSLLEAMSCGNIPIVTDVGNSRLIANESFAFFVEKNFSAKDLAEKCLKILTLSPDQFENKVSNARELVKQNFSREYLANYYLEMYDI